jgi:hypothetical protein
MFAAENPPGTPDTPQQLSRVYDTKGSKYKASTEKLMKKMRKSELKKKLNNSQI